MTPTQTHAALLISLKDSDFWPADMSLNKWADLVCDELRRLDAENQRLQALLAKLQPTQEPAQAGELPEPDADFLTRCERTDELIEYVKAYARAALAARKPLTEEQPVSDPDELPKGFIPLQRENGRLVYAACLDGGRYHGWLMWKHPDGQWVTKRKMESWEVMQAEDQGHYGIVQESTGINGLEVKP